jgi:hypothetical protein
MRRRLSLSLGASVLVLAVSATAAFGFECYNASRSAQGNAAAAGSDALETIADILADPNIVGLCPAGVDHVVAGLEDAGFRTDVLINSHALMAGGLEKNGKTDKLHDGKGIDHLSEEFFAAVEPLIGEGFGICFGG